MSRIVNTQSVGTERTRLTKAVVISIRELMAQGKPDSKTRDLAAFIALSLEAIADNVERTVIPWEKRDYWVKADRFRMEWVWARQLGDALRAAVLAEDWAQVAMLSAQIGEKLSKVQVSPNHRMGTPWVGAWMALRQKVG